MKHLLLLLTLLVFTTPAAAQKIKFDYDKSADFSKFKTFSWTRGAPPHNPLINQMIIDGVEQSLTAKGLTKVNDGGDLFSFGAVTGNGQRDLDRILDYDKGEGDALHVDAGVVAAVINAQGLVLTLGGGDGDRVLLAGVQDVGDVLFV